MPIRPAGNPLSGNDDEISNGFMTIDPEALAAAIPGIPSSKPITTTASDSEADMLFNLWESSSGTDGNLGVESSYTVPESFSADTILRLKTSSLISGDDKVIRFTNTGIGVIRTMLLGEENAFGAKAVKKPYSEILAEVKSLGQGSMLAFSSDNGTSLTKHAARNVEASANDRAMPDELVPVASTPFIQEARLTDTTGTANKEYIVRVFRMPDGSFSVMGYNGRIGSRLTAQKKGNFSSVTQAVLKAEEVVQSKLRSRTSNYEFAASSTSANIPGVDENLLSAQEATEVTQQDAVSRPEPTRPAPRRRDPSNPEPTAPAPRRRDPAAAPARTQEEKDTSLRALLESVEVDEIDFLEE
jgi:hypothetical protein